MSKLIGETLAKSLAGDLPTQTDGELPMVHARATAPALTQCRLLSGLSPKDLNAIVSAATNRRFVAGKVIFTAEEPAKHLYLLRKGMVKFNRVTRKGKEVLFDLLIPGDAFGLGTVLSRPLNYIGTAEPIEDSDILVWDYASIRRLASRYPRITENTLSIALYYVGLFAARHVNLLANTAEHRLAQTLTTLGIRAGQAHADGIEVSLKNEHLAALADVSSFTASRVLNKWARLGAIEKTRGKVVIRTPEKLLLD